MQDLRGLGGTMPEVASLEETWTVAAVIVNIRARK
jgi:hypothetical protein